MVRNEINVCFSVIFSFLNELNTYEEAYNNSHHLVNQLNYTF